MTDASAFLSNIKHYVDLLSNLVVAPTAFTPTGEHSETVQVERGIVLASSVVTTHPPTDSTIVEHLILLANSPRLADLTVVDRSGHTRPAYRALLVYSWLQSFHLVYETLPRDQFGRWEEGLRPWVDVLESRVGNFNWPVGSVSAGNGAALTDAIWSALSLHVAGKVFIRDAWTDLASDAFGRLTRAQTDTGAFLSASPSDNPETASYHELVLLHAAASYAVQSEDRPVASAVARNTLYHLNETQPDHATAQPWGLFAFIWNAPARSLADQLLHAVRTQQPEGPDGVSLMLLSDALYCLRLFL